MKKAIFALAFGAVALTAAPAASARVNLDIGINPFGYGYAPPVVYAPDYYDPPPVVYVGGGSWGGGRGWGGHRGGGHGGGRHR